MVKEWGPCTWYLFHTLAEKIKSEHFIELKNEILSNIIKICSNLPCPECAGHASNKLKSLNLNSIQTKNDLKNVLLSFHNDVNTRLNKRQWNETQLNDKYVLANTSQVVKYFTQIWNKPNSNPRLLSHNYHKKRVVLDFMKWWNINYSKFND